ncbi:MAG TPA: PVC-type heme-binding CxxCH protein [Verrucomicrobiae bacterium]
MNPGRYAFVLMGWLALVAGGVGISVSAAETSANRFTYLDESEPFYVHREFPKLITPQWVGEDGVEAVITLGIDDMREPEKYEAFLRPILQKLKEIDGRAPVSILTVNVTPTHPLLQSWLKEGLSIEVHTLTHPCPLLNGGKFETATNAVHGGTDLLSQILGNKPVAYRMPCCDSMNTPSPRFYAEIFNRTSADGRFLQIDTSVMNFPTVKDASLPKELVEMPDGSSRFYRYKVELPVRQGQKSLKSFSTTIEDYPYPYVIGKLCWEFPPTVPSDWEAFNLRGANQDETLADMKAAMDIAVRKQGTYNLVFHPHGWIRNTQIVELIDYAHKTYGKKVKFLTFKECLERLNKNLLMDQPLRAANGQDNGVRLLDLNNDGYQDVVIANDDFITSRIWDKESKVWVNTGFFTPLVTKDRKGNSVETGVRFGIVGKPNRVVGFVRSETETKVYTFGEDSWVSEPALLTGLQVEGEAVFTKAKGVDRGVRFRDVDKDGSCELIVGNATQNAVFSWNEGKKTWERRDFNLPRETSIVDAQGKDNGLRFVDINEDGFEDVIFSNAERYSLNLYVTNPVPRLGWLSGWSYQSRAGKRGEAGEIPMIVRGGEFRNNGAWFHSGHMWIQNEDTSQLPDVVDRRSYQQLLAWETPPPKSPEEALKTFQTLPGFKIELVASEPLVRDPVAFEWSEDGKLWVVEMNDYPLGMDGKGAPGGHVKYLEDTNGDGRYDKATVFLDKLPFPTGVMPWRKGVLVIAAPDLFYAEDTDGDGKADVRKVLFTGFKEGNQQHRVNGFAMGLDNWIYGANGDSGGQIKSEITGKVVDINRRDFRFKPDTGEFETQAGQTQYGRVRDDWGNWFGNNNPNWLWHYHIPEQYLGRNPLVTVRETRNYLANYNDSKRVYPISKPMTRVNQPQSMNYVTSGNSPSPYRDDLFGPDFATSVFASEPVHNVVHREVLTPSGVSFTSQRAKGEEQKEFLASTDHWFRPTMIKTGPDGAVYVADFYRFVLEHPEWISPEAQKALDLRAGEDKGRIYRVYPENAKLRVVPRLDKLNTAELVAAMDSSNGWQRDTVQRLLVQRQDKEAVELLKKIMMENKSAKVRLQALGTLEGLGAVDLAMLKAGWKDQHEMVREYAVKLAEGRAGDVSASGLSELGALVKDDSVRVRYQLAFALGEMENSGVVLAELVKRDFENNSMRIALMSSLPKHVETVAGVFLKQSPSNEPVLRAVFATAAVNHDATALNKMLKESGNVRGPTTMGIVAGTLEGLRQRKVSWAQFQLTIAEKEVMDLFARAFVSARQLAVKRDASETERLVALELCGQDAGAAEAESKLLSGLLVPQESQAIQKAALLAMRRINGSAGAETLVTSWSSLSPALRGLAFEAFVGRRDWLGTFLDGVQAGKIPMAQITPAQRQQLLNFPALEVKHRAEQLFKPTNQDRQALVKKYLAADRLVGRGDKGKQLFEQNCAACHRLAGLGQEIGPDLGMVGGKATDALLTSILDPNQVMEERYTAYTAEMTDGEEVNGVVVAETPAAITIKTAAGTEVVVSRSRLKGLRSSGLSLMPEGLEAVMDIQAMADLLAFLRKPQ